MKHFNGEACHRVTGQEAVDGLVQRTLEGVPVRIDGRIRKDLEWTVSVRDTDQVVVDISRKDRLGVSLIWIALLTDLWNYPREHFERVESTIRKP